MQLTMFTVASAPRRDAATPCCPVRCAVVLFAQRGSAPGRRRPVRPCAMLTKLGTPPEETHVKMSCGVEWLGWPYGAMRRGRAAAFAAKITDLLGLKCYLVRTLQ